MTPQDHALIEAVHAKNIIQVSQLLRKTPRANPNIKTEKGTPILVLAAAYNASRITTLLLQAGADVNARGASGKSALFIACQRGFIEVVQVLLQYQPDIHLSTADGVTPERVARANEYTNIVSLLHEYQRTRTGMPFFRAPAPILKPSITRDPTDHEIKYHVYLRLQDPTVQGLKIVRCITDFIPTNLTDMTLGFRVMLPAGKESLVFTPIQEGYACGFSEGSIEFDCIQTFIVAQRLITGFSNHYTALTQRPFMLNKDGQILRLFPRSREGSQDGKNAFYFLAKHEIHFGYFMGADGSDIQLCDSADLIAHEMGHALLTMVKPDLTRSDDREAQAICEAFGDLCAIAFLLEFPGLIEKALRDTQGDLMRPCYLNMIAEPFGRALGHPRGLRQLINDIKYSAMHLEPHQLSQVLSGAIYRILIQFFNQHRHSSSQPDPQILKSCYDHFILQVIAAILRTTEHTFAAIGKQLYEQETNPHLQDLIRSEFLSREIPVPGLLDTFLTDDGAGGDVSTIRYRPAATVYATRTPRHIPLVMGAAPPSSSPPESGCRLL
ncbi:MAG: hypothetical protein A3C55_03570 [Gammaproteobacteria bacterium RIFCSPHIGHO2_02_FULL_42_13]|nr:MAG: hypothetical protein A3C55_03570 [Gammaproteobacteria bacterium RIFCSPHIGHO2_02_FULL_42_13]OGT70733.1 MAG: hypothetical protein A3H43_04970 [Gammaproteobacteria bacterium RIFCSPLOWO2_02_FULL_42_9]